MHQCQLEGTAKVKVQSGLWLLLRVHGSLSPHLGVWAIAGDPSVELPGQIGTPEGIQLSAANVVILVSFLHLDFENGAPHRFNIDSLRCSSGSPRVVQRKARIIGTATSCPKLSILMKNHETWLNTFNTQLYLVEEPGGGIKQIL